MSTNYEAPHCATSSILQLGPNILLRTLLSNTLSLCSSIRVRDHVSHPHIYIIYFICLFIYLRARIAQSLMWLAASWMFKSSIRGWGKNVSPRRQVLTGPEAQLASSAMDSGTERLIVHIPILCPRYKCVELYLHYAFIAWNRHNLAFLFVYFN
jgi:hypothetical protein